MAAIVVKTMDKKVFKLDATEHKTVGDMCRTLAQKHGIAESRQQLIFQGKLLKEPTEALPKLPKGAFFD